MSEAPAEMWIRRSDGGYYRTMLEPPEPSAVRYVRADLYEALVERHNGLMARMAVVRSWNEAPCLEPLGALGSDDIQQRQRND